MDYIIVPYHENLEREWDRFVMQESANGTFLQTRRFLNYHPEGRFQDVSFCVLDQRDVIVAVCPAALVERDEKRVCISHPGSTYGGIVICKTYCDKIEHIINIFRLMDHHFMRNFSRVELRITPDLFSTGSNKLIQYALYYFDFSQYIELNSYVDLQNKTEEDIWNGLDRNKKRNIRKCKNRNIEVRVLNSKNEVREFHHLLEKNLEKFGVKPIHTVREMIDFKDNRLQNETIFIGAFDSNKMVSAGMLFDFEGPKVLHAQNLSRDLTITEYAPVCSLYYESILLALKKGYKAMSWGISTENHGKMINMGLVYNKDDYGSTHDLVRTYYKNYNQETNK